MEVEYILHICDYDDLYMVCRRSARTPYVYRTLAQCFDRASAEICFEALKKAKA